MENIFYQQGSNSHPEEMRHSYPTTESENDQGDMSDCDFEKMPWSRPEEEKTQMQT
jgi:hypothetical protein